MISLSRSFNACRVNPFPNFFRLGLVRLKDDWIPVQAKLFEFRHLLVQPNFVYDTYANPSSIMALTEPYASNSGYSWGTVVPFANSGEWAICVSCRGVRSPNRTVWMTSFVTTLRPSQLWRSHCTAVSKTSSSLQHYSLYSNKTLYLKSKKSWQRDDDHEPLNDNVIWTQEHNQFTNVQIKKLFLLENVLEWQGGFGRDDNHEFLTIWSLLHLLPQSHQVSIIGFYLFL